MSEYFDLKNLDIKELLGAGGFGKVYKVFDKTKNEVYAAKVSKISFDEIGKSASLNITREVNLMAQIKHLGIIRFIGYSPINFNNNPKPVILLEYCSNGTLQKYIDLERKSLSPKEWDNTKKLINIYGIASAMSYLHQNNIIHRDLKPENILEDDYLFPKLADFGLSKQNHQNSASMTDQSAICLKGTLKYISPEVFKNNEFTKAGDVYSFGITIYELITLEEAFPNLNIYMHPVNVVNGVRPTFKYQIPECYHNLITRCWSNNPDERLTFDEIVEMLKTDKDFIIDGVDKDEFDNYIEMIESSEKSFDKYKKFKKVIVSPDEIFREKVVEEAKVEENITTSQSMQKASLPSNQSQNVSQKVLENNSKSGVGNQISIQKVDLKNAKSQQLDMTPSNIISKYRSISEKVLNIPVNEVAVLQDSNSFDSPELVDSIKHFENVMIECEYPSAKSDQLISSYQSMQQKIKTAMIKFIITDLKSAKNLAKIPFCFSVSFAPSIDKIDTCLNRSKQLVAVTIPSTIKTIIFSAFADCSSLKKVTFESPSSVAEIPDSLFSNCASLTDVNIPSSVTKIGRNVFSKCSSLKQIVIPSSVTQIGINTFPNCISLTSVTISSSLTKIESNFMAICTSLVEITIPSSVVEICTYAFDRCSSLKKVTFESPSSLIIIGNYVFQRCTSLEQIEIPSSVVKIGDRIFKECKVLKKVTLPSCVRSSVNNLGFDKNNKIDIQFI